MSVFAFSKKEKNLSHFKEMTEKECHKGLVQLEISLGRQHLNVGSRMQI